LVKTVFVSYPRVSPHGSTAVITLSWGIMY
jgi:hypothetical protein